MVSDAELYNVEKSSFLNALIGSKEEFNVSDRKETSENKVFNWTKDIDLVDNSGIDSFNARDKTIALESFKKFYFYII
ncbi:GTPase [Clostridioides difficile]